MGLPDTGRDRESLQAEMENRALGDADWEEGRTWALVYSANEEIHELRKDASGRFSSENALNPMAFPSALSFETDVVNMVADMMNHPDAVGNVTSGGTESILCAVYAARERAREVDDVTDPTLVVPETAHPAWEKAAHYLGLEPIRTETRGDWRADPAAMADAVTDRTALVAVSAPSYPHGVVDPVEEVAAEAKAADVPCHVDACVGGFVFPFLEEMGHDVPAYDFSVDGVTSISVDPHKYGYTTKGVSTVLYRDKELRSHQYYAFADWPGGIYVAPNFQGSRSAGPIAAAWAVMNFLGRDGYRELVEAAMTATERITEFVDQRDELAVVSDPDMSLLAIESTGPEVDIWTVQRELATENWEISRQQRPRNLHLAVMAGHAPVVDEFLADFEAAVETAKASDDEELTAPMYGLSGNVNADDENITDTLVDLLNDTFV